MSVDKTAEAIERESKQEPTLQLLVIDLGDSCVVRMEKGTLDVLDPSDMHQMDGGVYAINMPFPQLRSAIDGEKPVPRIETELNQSGYTDYILRYKDGDTICVQFLTQSQFTTLSELAGKPLPIYECGKWDELIALQSKDEYGDWIDKRDFTAWRYTR